MYAKGIAEASGRVVAFLDDDDMFAQGKLKAVLEAYGSSKSLGLYRHAVTFVNERGEPLTAPQGTPVHIPEAVLPRTPLAVRVLSQLANASNREVQP